MRKTEQEEQLIFDQVNNTRLDHFQIDSLGTTRELGDDVLVIDCCWSDGAPYHVYWKLYFHEVSFLSCSIHFDDAVFRYATAAEHRDLTAKVDIGEFASEERLYCVETNRPDIYTDPKHALQFRTEKFFILAQRVELRAGEMQSAGLSDE